MDIQQNIPLLEGVLADWKTLIDDDFIGYRNHLYRMLNFCFSLQNCSAEEQEKLIIAACFHDIGIWIDKTADYIPPSIPPAMQYLALRGLDKWAIEIQLMISEHHKVTAYSDPNYPLVELFRKGDLVDFSLGLVKFGLPKSYVDRVKGVFPNAGFHKNLCRLGAKWFIKHPLNPVPMMKW